MGEGGMEEEGMGEGGMEEGEGMIGGEGREGGMIFPSQIWLLPFWPSWQVLSFCFLICFLWMKGTMGNLRGFLLAYFFLFF